MLNLLLKKREIELPSWHRVFLSTPDSIRSLEIATRNDRRTAAWHSKMEELRVSDFRPSVDSFSTDYSDVLSRSPRIGAA